jgi:hypothetical protein
MFVVLILINTRAPAAEDFSFSVREDEGFIRVIDLKWMDVNIVSKVPMQYEPKKCTHFTLMFQDKPRGLVVRVSDY